MAREPIGIRKLYRQLLRCRPTPFPRAGERLVVPDKHGVYIIYASRGTVLHVGRTLRGKRGLRQRLNNHLHGNSSFTIQFLRGKGSKLRGTHKFAFVEVSDARARALLEAFAIGCLCPKHLGVGENAA
jgi:excinuclease UvrABC nuclease subunit